MPAAVWCHSQQILAPEEMYMQVLPYMYTLRTGIHYHARGYIPELLKE